MTKFRNHRIISNFPCLRCGAFMCTDLLVHCYSSTSLLSKKVEIQEAAEAILEWGWGGGGWRLRSEGEAMAINLKVAPSEVAITSCFGRS